MAKRVGEPVGHDLVVSACRLDGGGVELQELDGVAGAVIALGESRLNFGGHTTRRRERVNAMQPVAYVATPCCSALRFCWPTWPISSTSRFWRLRWSSIPTRASAAVSCTIKQS